MFFNILLASNLLLHNVDYQRAQVPAVCDIDTEVFSNMKRDGFSPWIYTKMEKDHNELVIIVWRTPNNNEISVTRTLKGEGKTCIVGWGDKDTTIFEPTPKSY